MPRYNYKCSNCEVEMIIVHSMNDKIDFCTNCQEFGTMVKLLTTPLYKNKNTDIQKIGETTKEYIEKNREILEQEKKNAKRDTYEPT
jgi:Zn-finger nucleic acid-binding protein